MTTDNGSKLAPQPALSNNDTDIESRAAAQVPHPKPALHASSRWRDTLSTTHAGLFFVLCSLITGLCDGVSYASFGCFISMQTGNTIFVGLGAAGLPTTKPYGWLKSLTSISSFFLGSMVFATAMRRVGNRLRRTLTVSFTIQALLIFVAAIIVQSDVIPHGLDDHDLDSGPLFLQLIPLAILAFQFGGQMAASRAMGFNELPTVVLTSVYFDVASDPALAASPKENPKRNRRVGSITAITVGAIAAGWLCRSAAEMQGALWISGFIKTCIAVGWALWPAAKAGS
ncbi:hypothetical protein VTN31DRAFT_6461 [Thermomyces dupontii]|uniref:uncharacterized protein n=1 Tax=Talaromyces thermophilus TaxID=28565 RepID=UPI0037433D18